MDLPGYSTPDYMSLRALESNVLRFFVKTFEIYGSPVVLWSRINQLIFVIDGLGLR